jgi:hypothetical protein
VAVERDMTGAALPAGLVAAALAHTVVMGALQFLALKLCLSSPKKHKKKHAFQSQKALHNHHTVCSFEISGRTSSSENSLT